MYEPWQDRAVWKTLHKPNHADYADKASSNGKVHCYQVDSSGWWLGKQAWLLMPTNLCKFSNTTLHDWIINPISTMLGKEKQMHLTPAAEICAFISLKKHKVCASIYLYKRTVHLYFNLTSFLPLLSLLLFKKRLFILFICRWSHL